MTGLVGYHHLTLATDGAQEDYEFYTKTLGLYSVKKTVLFDGVIPIYHLYYGSIDGAPSTIITTFPFRKPAIYGQRGTNQSRCVMQTIPMGSAQFWIERLNSRGIPAQEITRFGAVRVSFDHPCGIPHELVESEDDLREPVANEAHGISKEHGIKGIYGGLVACFDRTAMDDFLTVALPLTKEADSHEGAVFRIQSANGSIQRVEVVEDRISRQGSWTLAGGTVHHLALDTGDEETQLRLRTHIEGLGFTDISEQKDRNYFKSCYVRSPGGALFELAWTTPEGFTKDEPAGALGKTLVFPPWFKDREQEMRAGLEEADFN